MTRKEHLLTIAAEECNEVAQRISKALRFSLEEVQPGQDMTNAQRILLEYNDLICVLLMLHEEGHLPAVSPTKDPICNMAWVYAKKAKVDKFLLHSKENGTLTD
jgi:hypothetical protein